MCSHPNPQHDYGENEIGTPMKPSERIEEIAKENMKSQTMGLGVSEAIEFEDRYTEQFLLRAVIKHLDEQAEKGKEL